MSTLVILVVIAIAQITSVHGSCSYYQFMTQPPLTLDCNPYNNNTGISMWRLRIECEVDRITSNPDSRDAGTFDVHWFRRDPVTSEVHDLGRVDIFNQQDPPTIDEVHIIYGRQLVNVDFREDMLGDYWCQVINTTTTPHTGLGISNILTILHPDEYSSSLASCSTVKNETVTCADYNNQPVMETTISSSSIQSTATSTSNIVSQTTPSYNIPEISVTSYNAQETSVTEITISSSISQTNMITPTDTTTDGTRAVTMTILRTTSLEDMNNRIPKTNTNTNTLSSFISSTPSTSVNGRNRNTNEVSSATSTATTATQSTGTATHKAAHTTGTAFKTDTTTAILGISTMFPQLVQTPISTMRPSTPAPADVSILGTDMTHLILAASIGGAMLILIIILLTIVVALLCTNKNRSQHTPRDECEKINNEMQRMSALRSSQRPLLLDSTSQSPDSTQFTTSYSTCESQMLPDPSNATTTPQSHHYSVIRDSTFQTSQPAAAQHVHSPPFVLPEMTDNQYYSTADEVISTREISPLQDNNQYSSLKPNNTDSNSAPSDGYNKLRQHTPPSPHDPAGGAYSTLYDPSSMNATMPIDDQVEPYNTLSYNTQNSNSGSNGLMSAPQQKPSAVNGTGKPLFKVVAGSSMTNDYDEVYDDSSQQESPTAGRGGFDDPQYSVVMKPEVAPKTKKTKTAAILPPNYKGDYERDPNYSFAYK